MQTADQTRVIQVEEVSELHLSNATDGGELMTRRGSSRVTQSRKWEEKRNDCCSFGFV